VTNILNQITELSIERVMHGCATYDVVNLIDSKPQKAVLYRHLNRFDPDKDSHATITKGAAFNRFLLIAKFLSEKKQISYQAKGVLDGVNYSIFLESCGSISQSVVFCPEYSPDPEIKQLGVLLDEFYSSLEKKH
jgi:hypothetical protein